LVGDSGATGREEVKHGKQESHQPQGCEQGVENADQQGNGREVEDGGCQCAFANQGSEETDLRKGSNRRIQNPERWADKQGLQVSRRQRTGSESREKEMMSEKEV